MGKTDYEFFPKYVADNFVRDDQQVLATGKPLIGRVETWYDSQHQLDWFVTTKLPLFDAAGRAVGIIGLIQNHRKQGKPVVQKTPLGVVLDYAATNHDRTVSIEELAQAAGISSRQLLRQCREEFGMGAKELVMQTQIQAASQALLRDGATIAGVASDFGFFDQSAFTRQFCKYMDCTPLEFLRKYGQHFGEALNVEVTE